MLASLVLCRAGAVWLAGLVVAWARRDEQGSGDDDARAGVHWGVIPLMASEDKRGGQSPVLERARTTATAMATKKAADQTRCTARARRRSTKLLVVTGRPLPNAGLGRRLHLGLNDEDALVQAVEPSAHRKGRDDDRPGQGGADDLGDHAPSIAPCYGPPQVTVQAVRFTTAVTARLWERSPLLLALAVLVAVALVAGMVALQGP